VERSLKYPPGIYLFGCQSKMPESAQILQIHRRPGKKGTVYKKHITLIVFFALLLIVGAGLWQLGKSSNPRTVVLSGWSGMQPRDAGIHYNLSSAAFSASFNNAVVTNIDIKSVIVTEELSKMPCAKVTVNGMDPSVSPAKVAVGYTFRMEALCPDAKKKKGDPYSMKIAMDYSTSVGGITSRTETGYIRGTVE
jgi:hypothetical protein